MTMDAEPPRARGPIATGIAGTMTLAAVLYALDVPRAAGLNLYTEQYLAAILAFALVLTFLVAPRFSGRLRFVDPVLSGAGAAAAGYVAFAYPALVNELVYKPWQGVLISLVIGALTIEAVRRLTGPGLTAIVALFLVYGLLGHLLPLGMSRQILWDRLSIYVVMDTNGLLGLPLMVTATMVFSFILLGQLLVCSGGSAFFNDLALALVGRTRGGAAKIAVVSSFLFGSVSGSAVANVAASGGVTLPLMRRAGYKPHMAAAIEALASTGGQLAPPIMGAAAFLMAEFLQISFATVVLAAIIPSALYYVAIFFYVDAHAAANGMTLPSDVEIRPLGRVLADGWQFVVPFVIPDLRALRAQLAARVGRAGCDRVAGRAGVDPAVSRRADTPARPGPCASGRRVRDGRDRGDLGRRGDGHRRSEHLGPVLRLDAATRGDGRGQPLAAPARRRRGQHRPGHGDARPWASTSSWRASSARRSCRRGSSRSRRTCSCSTSACCR